VGREEKREELKRMMIQCVFWVFVIYFIMYSYHTLLEHRYK